MLANTELFQTVENVLNEQGIIGKFEAENGKIVGRMMITLGEVPENLKDEVEMGDGDFVFVGTFDFYDAAVGLVLNTATRQAKSGLWVTPQTEDAEPPSNEWCNFFVETLASSLKRTEDSVIRYIHFVPKPEILPLCRQGNRSRMAMTGIFSESDDRFVMIIQDYKR